MRRHRRRSDRPTRARIVAPAVGLLEDSPRHTATPRMPLRAKRRATLDAPFARQGAPVVAVRRSPALRASPRTDAESRMDATVGGREAAPPSPIRSTNPCANRCPCRGLARRLAAPHGYTSRALAGEETRDPPRSVRPAGRTSRSRAAQPGFAGKPTGGRRAADGCARRRTRCVATVADVDRPTRVRIVAPSVGLLEDSPRHTATPRMPLRAKRRATLDAPFARRGAPVVAVRRSPALRASPRAGDEPRMDAHVDGARRRHRRRCLFTNPCANRCPFRGLARRLAAPHGYASHALAGDRPRPPGGHPTRRLAPTLPSAVPSACSRRSSSWPS